jgi:hypothetical protein
MCDIYDDLVDILDPSPPPGLEIHGPSRTLIEVSLNPCAHAVVVVRARAAATSKCLNFILYPLFFSPGCTRRPAGDDDCVPQRSISNRCAKGGKKRGVGRRFGSSGETTQQFLSPLSLRNGHPHALGSSRSSVPRSSILRAAGWSVRIR